MCFGGRNTHIYIIKPVYKLYRYHVENLRSLELALGHISRASRESISNGNEKASQSFTRLYAFLLGAWFETRLKKLIHEPNSFTLDERKVILASSNQYDKWLNTIELAFRKKYNVPSAKISQNSLPFSAFSRFQELKRIFSLEIKNIIEIRNKLAHGQWIFPFNSDEDDIQNDTYQQINKENILSLQFKKKIVFNVAYIITDLVVSKLTFERDFDKHYSDITMIMNQLSSKSYDDYKSNLINKKKNGIIKRKGKSSSSSRPL